MFWIKFMRFKIVLIGWLIFLIIIMPMSTIVRAAESPFIDIERHWGKNYINNTYNKEIVKGYPGNIFKPDGQITRAEMAVIIVKALGLEPVKQPILEFVDTYDIEAWAIGYVATAVNEGIIKGYPNGTFMPANHINRSEIAIMTIRAIGIVNPVKTKTVFLDDINIPTWSKSFVAEAYDLGIISGYEQGGSLYFHSNNKTTRAEVCVIIDKICITNDLIAPTIPKSLRITDTTNELISLKWDQSKDIMGVEGYKVYRNDTLIADIVKNTYTDKTPDIVLGTTYNYVIIAYDKSGNISKKSTYVKINFELYINIYNINTGEPKNVLINEANSYFEFVRGSSEILIYSKIDGHESTCVAEKLESMINVNWVTSNTQLTMYDTENSITTVLGKDILVKLRLGWTWVKRTAVQEAWKIPYQPLINGPTALDRIVTNYVIKINNNYVSSGAINYYYAAVNQGCLPEKYKTSLENRDASIALIAEDLKWNQNKINRLWQEAAAISEKYGNVIDPRLLFSVILHEGTGSFNTNVSPSSPKDGGGYIQPDFEMDLLKAFNNHILGKIWAYSNYAKDFKAASLAGQGTNFTVNIDQKSPPTKKVITYYGKGDLFEYTNNNVPRIRWNNGTGAYVVSYGVYATDYNWCNNLRNIYEVISGSNSANKYSEFIKLYPIPWPQGLQKPNGSFVLTNKGTEWTGKYSGYPMINFVIK